VRTKHGRGFLDTEANEREWIKSVALTELSSLTASSTMRRLGFFFFFGASPLHTKTIANDREIRIRQACYLERRLTTEQGRSTRRFLGRAASRAPQQHDRATGTGGGLQACSAHFFAALCPAPALPQALPCRAKRRDSGRARRQQRGACTPRTRRATPAASSACSCAAAPARAAAKRLRALRISFKRETAGIAVRGRDEASSARGRGARFEVRGPYGQAHTRLLLRHQWSPSLPVAGLGVLLLELLS
jgi:hypothetical protein